MYMNSNMNLVQSIVLFLFSLVGQPCEKNQKLKRVWRKCLWQIGHNGHQETRCYVFAIVRKLKAFSLDPKYNLESKHVIVVECWFLFGGSRKFKMKSPSLKLENKAGMEETYWRVFGATSITNYEMPT